MQLEANDRHNLLFERAAIEQPRGGTRPRQAGALFTAPLEKNEEKQIDVSKKKRGVKDNLSMWQLNEKMETLIAAKLDPNYSPWHSAVHGTEMESCLCS